jgi:DNA-binding transcriptional LysR family regulator
MIPSSSFDLNDYFYFYHVVEMRGFAPAGRALSIPKSRLSRHIQKLETRLDARLIQRSSRQFELTDIGQEFFSHAKAVIEKVHAAEASVEFRKQELSGKIRISCSPGVAQFALERLIADFIKLHPKVEIGQQVTNELVSLIEARIDLAIRGHAETLEDSSLIQKKVANVEWNLFASPKYLEELGTPKTPADLKSQQGICLGWNKDFAEWKMRSLGGETAKIQFVPRLSSDDMVTLRNASTAGVGIVSLPSYVCKPEVEAGRLVRVLPKWSTGSATLSFLQPTREGVLPAVSVFAEFIGEQLPKVVSD